MKNRLFYVLMIALSYVIFSTPMPAFAQITLVGEKIQKEQVLPGEQYSGAVMIHNESDTALILRLYQDEITALSSFDNGEEIVTVNRSNADWVTLEAEKVVVEAGEIAEVGYQVVVPMNWGAKAPSGSYWSSFSVDVIGKDGTEYRRPISRHHLADLVTQFKDTGEPELAINGLMLKGNMKERKIQAMMINTGNVLVKPNVRFELYDTAGNLEKSINGHVDWIYPGGFDRIVADINGLKPGIYETQIVVDAGGDQIFGKSFTLDNTGVRAVAQSGMSRTLY